jgi:1-acyl-sn-glycerol-3-phosphate acyltransferase
MVNRTVAVARLTGFVLLTLLLIPPHALLMALGRPAGLARPYWRRVVRLMGFRIRTHGTPVARGPALIIANHASYLDIVVLGSLLQAAFVAKSEVAGWPGFGLLARLGRTIFVDRRPRSTAGERDRLRTRLDAGETLILFPEGTSNDGNRVLPFKSSLFAAAGTDGSLPVQPVTVAYTGLDGLPLPRAFRAFYAWYGDMTLAGHLFAVLGLGNATIDVIFHPPVTVADFANRKTLAQHCHTAVQRGLSQALSGRIAGDSLVATALAEAPAPPDSTGEPADIDIAAGACS